MQVTFSINAGWQTFLAIFLIIFGASAFVAVDPLIMKIGMFCAIVAGLLIVFSIATGRSNQS